MRKKLRLYVWQGVLCDYTAGIAFALASSPEEAVKLVEASGVDSDHWDGTKLDGVEPDAYDTPVGFHEYGGS